MKTICFSFDLKYIFISLKIFIERVYSFREFGNEILVRSSSKMKSFDGVAPLLLQSLVFIVLLLRSHALRIFKKNQIKTVRSKRRRCDCLQPKLSWCNHEQYEFHLIQFVRTDTSSDTHPRIGQNILIDKLIAHKIYYGITFVKMHIMILFVYARCRAIGGTATNMVNLIFHFFVRKLCPLI